MNKREIKKEKYTNQKQDTHVNTEFVICITSSVMQPDKKFLLLWNLEAYYCMCRSTTLDFIFRKLNAVHTCLHGFKNCPFNYSCAPVITKNAQLSDKTAHNVVPPEELHLRCLPNSWTRQRLEPQRKQIPSARLRLVLTQPVSWPGTRLRREKQGSTR